MNDQRIKLSITKSRAGHYTVSIRDSNRVLVFHRNLIDNLHMARRIAAEAEHAYRNQPTTTE
jgi:hypothetical protein